MLDRRFRRRAGAAAVAANEHDIGVALRHTGRDRTHARLGYELDMDTGLRVGIFQIVDQLGEILDRVYVVMWWRGDQFYPWRRAADRADVLVYLVAWQLAALAGLGALGHLDLEVRGVDQVVGGHTKPA